jgi:hypothetical protein
VLPASIKSVLRILRDGGWGTAVRDCTRNGAAGDGPPSQEEWLSVILSMFDEVGRINDVAYSHTRVIPTGITTSR